MKELNKNFCYNLRCHTSLSKQICLTNIFKLKTLLLLAVVSFSTSSYAGVSAKITVKKFNGEIIKDFNLRIYKFDRNAGTRVEVYKGKTNGNGELHIKGILEPEYADYKLYYYYPGRKFTPLSTVGKKDGDFIELNIRIGPNRGDMAPDLELIDVFTRETVKLSDFKGKAVYMDFWATWCGPCQGPMHENNEAMKKNKEKWQGKAVIIGIGEGDKDPKTVKEHVLKKGWTSFPQYWVKRKANSAYCIDRYPTAILIDKNGKVFRRGHPAVYKAEEEITKLLASYERADDPHKNNYLFNSSADEKMAFWRGYNKYGNFSLPSRKSTFYVEGTTEKTSHMWQYVDLPSGSNGKYMLMVAYAWRGRKVDAKANWGPFLKAYEMTDREYIINYINNDVSTMAHNSGPEHWQALYKIHKLEDNSSTISFFIHHGVGKAVFDDLGLYIFDTEAEAQSFVKDYINKHPTVKESAGEVKEPLN